MTNQSPYTLPLGNQPSQGNFTAAGGPQINVGQQQPQQAQQPQESWWKKLLPTAGAIGGGILGEVLDPFGGGIAGAALGSSLLGGAGQAAGKIGENLSSGQSLGSGVLSNALQGAAFGGVGKLAGMGLEGVGGALAGRGGNIEQTAMGAGQEARAAQEEAVQRASQQTAKMQSEADLKAAQDQKVNASIANWSGVKTDTVNNLAQHKFTLEKLGVDSSSPTAVNNHALTVLSQAGGKLNQVLDSQPAADMTGWLDSAVNKFGLKPQFSTLQDVGKSIPNIPSEMISKALAEEGSASAKAASALNGSGSSLEEGINAFLKSHVDENGNALYTLDDLNSGKMPLKDLKDLRSEIGTQQNIEKANSQSQGKLGTPEAQTTYKINSNNLNSIKDDLTSKISTPGVNKAIGAATVTPEEEQTIRAAFPNSPQAAQNIIEGINNAKSYEDINKLLSPAMEMKNVSNEALQLLKKGSGAGVTARKNLGANIDKGIFEAPSTAPAQVPIKPIKPEMPPMPVETPGSSDQILQALQGAHPVAGAAVGTAKAIKALGSSPSFLKRAGGLLSRIGGITAPTALGGGALASAAAGAPAGGAQQPLGQGVNMQQQPNPLQNLLAQATNNYVLDPLDFGQSSQGMISSLLPTLQTQAKAQSQLDALRQLYSGAGGAGGLGGNSIFNKIASELPFTQQAAAMRQAQSLGNTLGVNPGLSFLQNPQTANVQFGTLQNLIQGLGGVNPGMAMPAGQ